MNELFFLEIMEGKIMTVTVILSMEYASDAL